MNFQAVVFRITYAVFSNTCSLDNTHFRDYLLKITYGKHLGLELNYLQEEIREVGLGGEGVEGNGTRFFANQGSQFKKRSI